MFSCSYVRAFAGQQLIKLKPKSTRKSASHWHDSGVLDEMETGLITKAGTVLNPENTLFVCAYHRLSVSHSALFFFHNKSASASQKPSSKQGGTVS
jgi:hypothetical protein